MTPRRNDANSPGVESADHFASHEQLADDVFALRSQVDESGVAVLQTSDATLVAAAVVALDAWASEVRLVPPGLDLPVEGGTRIVVAGGPAKKPVAGPPLTEPTRWVLYTSGTTGEPKAISHTRASLSRTVSSGGSHSFTWGLLYDPNRMAGIQVILQALAAQATLIAPPLDDPLSTRVTALVDRGVNALSATPSLWRQILQLPISAGWALEQITLGGEIADQRVLTALRQAFPAARIVHVFASTETGAAFSVKDGREGFPLTYLSEPPRGIPIQIRDDVLHVYSPGVSTSDVDGFASTGDIVEVVGDRVLFRGRASGVVNVGGSNVWPEVVESILRLHPDVAEAVVSSKPNPMMGNVLVAQVALHPSADPEGATKRLRSWVRGQAPGTHVPASVTIVDSLAISSTGKVAR